MLTSLWRVGDGPTADLMGDFYRLLWVEGRSAPRALWEAKRLARDRGVDFADWAAWVLTGL